MLSLGVVRVVPDGAAERGLPRDVRDPGEGKDSVELCRRFGGGPETLDAWAQLRSVIEARAVEDGGSRS